MFDGLCKDRFVPAITHGICDRQNKIELIFKTHYFAGIHHYAL
jgi:hypothetical protein